MNIKIFRANRGEGKTKWLFERAVEAYESGRDLYYVGSNNTMEAFTYMWEANMHTKCPIINTFNTWKTIDPLKSHCFITDGLLSNAGYVADAKTYLMQLDGVWYMTMDKEDFVN